MEAERALPLAEYYADSPAVADEPADPQLYVWSNELAAAATASTPDGAYARWGKRFLDVALGVPLLVMAVPIILMAALAIRFTSPGPIFYKASRLGRGGREFSMWKLRTMVPDADACLREWKASRPDLAEEYEQHFKLQDDPRITKVGRWLRRSSIDELPQLWNVIRGEMSLVGPRPIVADELRHYGRGQDDLLSVRPGITGPWQLEGRNSITYPERSWFEVTYCRKFALASDLRILAGTLLTPFRFNGR